MSDVGRAFGAGVRARRQMLCMTQQDLADAVGTDNVQISRIENARHGVTLASAVKVADALGTTVDALLGVSTPDPLAGVTEVTYARISATLGEVGERLTELMGWLAERDR